MVGFRVFALVSLLCLACATEDADPVDQPDAGMIDDSGGEPTFMEPCDVSDDACQEPYFCFNYNSKGPHCTTECTRDDQCEAPSTGCNMMGVCKAP